MNRRVFLSGAALAPALLDADTEAGFVSLFDGATLNGWSVQQGPESAFFVKDGAIVVHEGSNFPTWLRYDREFENFDFQCEFFVKGWINSGLYLHAPEHGRNTWCGMKINIFHKQDAKPLPESMGSVFPVVAPLKVNVRNKGEWNTMRVLMDWPVLRVWTNGELVQDLDLESIPELRHRLRRGYLGLESLSYPIRFRNLRLRELPAKVKWTVLYETAADFEKWYVAEGKALWEPLGHVLRADNIGYLATHEKFQDFELQMYIRASQWSNGGILFRVGGETSASPHYEIQIHDVEGAVYPTGSLYGYQRAIYPRIEPEKWYLLQLVVKGKDCLVRINGENVVDYHDLARNTPSPIMLQAHANNHWIEYKQILIRRI